VDPDGAAVCPGSSQGNRFGSKGARTIVCKVVQVSGRGHVLFLLQSQQQGPHRKGRSQRNVGRKGRIERAVRNPNRAARAASKGPFVDQPAREAQGCVDACRQRQARMATSLVFPRAVSKGPHALPPRTPFTAARLDARPRASPRLAYSVAVRAVASHLLSDQTKRGGPKPVSWPSQSLCRRVKDEHTTLLPNRNSPENKKTCQIATAKESVPR
jgi:hypothetical protein